MISSATNPKAELLLPGFCNCILLYEMGNYISVEYKGKIKMNKWLPSKNSSNESVYIEYQ
jgi:hypothetical protein